MRIIGINAVSFGSTGTIMRGIAHEARKREHQFFTFSRKLDRKNVEYPFHEYFNSINEFWVSEKATVLNGFEGTLNLFSSLKLLAKIRKIDPQIIHLHNLHGWYVNLPMLFRFIKKHNIRVVWTLHDCWSFTGHCPYFDIVSCDKWKTGCHHCPQYREYPASIFDNSKKMYKRKKKWFTGVKDMTIVTPSAWLAGLVKESFLKEYPVQVINNGIDLNVFKPTESDFRENYGLEGKYIILGVAFDWGERKGLDVFVELAKRLDDRYQIVLVGTDDEADKLLPDNILSIHRTQNQTELAEIYTAADLFVNPTREEVCGLVNLEALACGTPGVTFNSGGSPECYDDTCGTVVEKNDTDAMEREIVRICTERPFSEAACRKRAEAFDKVQKFGEYIQLYGSEL